METVFLFIIACAALPYALPVMLLLVIVGVFLHLIWLLIAFVFGMPHLSIPLFIISGLIIRANKGQDDETKAAGLPIEA